MANLIKKFKGFFDKTEDYQLEAITDKEINEIDQNRTKLKQIELLMKEVLRNDRSFLTPPGIREMKKILNDSSINSAKKLDRIQEVINTKINEKKPDILINEFFLNVKKFLTENKSLPELKVLKNQKYHLDSLNQFLKTLPETNAIKIIKNTLKHSTLTYREKIETLKKMEFPEKNDDPKNGNKFCRLLVEYLEDRSNQKGPKKEQTETALYKDLEKEKYKLEVQSLQNVLAEVKDVEQPETHKKKW